MTDDDFCLLNTAAGSQDLVILAVVHCLNHEDVFVHEQDGESSAVSDFAPQMMASESSWTFSLL